MAKGKAMLDARPDFASQLDFVQINDFEQTGVFDEAIKDIDAVIHVASVGFHSADEAKYMS
jgi:nucleoside-diphosphate-sugar epimerase